MANHNILITNPQGTRRHHFLENQTRDTCQEWLEEYGPAPIGWLYQIVNLHKKPRKYPDYTLIKGYGFNKETGDLELMDERKVHVQHNNGQWYTPKKAKRDARALGAVYFERKKVWDNVQT